MGHETHLPSMAEKSGASLTTNGSATTQREISGQPGVSGD
jgi:hypothetical protein